MSRLITKVFLLFVYPFFLTACATQEASTPIYSLNEGITVLAEELAKDHVLNKEEHNLVVEPLTNETSKVVSIPQTTRKIRMIVRQKCHITVIGMSKEKALKDISSLRQSREYDQETVAEQGKRIA